MTTKKQDEPMQRDHVKAEMDFLKAFNALQSELPVVGKNAETGAGKFSWKYATFENIWSEVMPLVNKHGFILRFKDVSGGDKIGIRATLTHIGGHSELNSMFADADHSGSKNAVQAQASTRTYLRRYTMVELLNIAVGGEDDDAQSVAAPAMIYAEQAAHINKLIHDSKSDKDKFCKAFSITDIRNLAIKDYNRAEALLKKKMEAQ